MGTNGGFSASLHGLTTATLATHGAVIFLTVILARGLWSWYRLRHLPGPFLAFVSSIWMVRKALSGRFHEHRRDVPREYGSLVRIGPNDLISTDTNVLRMMSAVRSPYTKGIFYETGRIIPEENTVVSLRNDAEHRALRAKMGTANEGFGFGAGIDRQILEFVKLIDDKYLSTPTEYRPVQFFQKVSFFALDVIGDISFGTAFGYLSQDEDLYRYHEINDEALPVMNIMSTMPWLASFLYKWPFNTMLPKEGDRVGFGRLMGFAKSCVTERLEPDARPRKDMTQAFINSGMTPAELTQQVFVQIIPGSVTTTTAICMTLLCLIMSPSAYASLRREIDATLASGRLSSPVTDLESRSMPYLQSVIREGLRMYPPVLGLGSKQVPRGGDSINGFFVPEGTQIGMIFFGLMRSTELWGPDADVSRPERWLEASEDDLRKMKAAVDMDFGSGKYQCLGKPIAMMELNKIFVELLRRYDFTIVNPKTPIKAWSAIFWVATDFWLRVTKRP
ncbi:Uu.00g025620.m01.CDS01 [Anthostomella pinea]|uniref:Uu.00g025620.m01.CDS01 n=1 Tax=Anthostomella pinea TaxID=933095 RepID=A0AAI8YA44_9PEZI|nr:Uu.00g025620.m01.CDS01 [Anthostomella pinea]